MSTGAPVGVERAAVAVILARAGSKGLARKNMLPVAGRPCALWTVEQALAAAAVGPVIVSTDDGDLRAACEHLRLVSGVARERLVISARPAELATDSARVDDALRHAVGELPRRRADFIVTDATPIVLLYGNVPVRPDDLIDRAVGALIERGADSVQSYSPAGKHHPWWTARIDPVSGAAAPWPAAESPAPGRLFCGVYRRQDLPPAYIPDGGVTAVTYGALMGRLAGASVPAGPHAFLGRDDRRCGVVTAEGAVIDIDSAADQAVAEAALRARGVAIGARRIGAAHPPLVIAEIGVNHDGSPGKALELTLLACEAGADAVKFQYFQAERLMSGASRLAGYQQAAGESDPIGMLRRLELPLEALAACVDEAHARGVAAIVTVFSTELVVPAAHLPWDAFKTASPDIIHRPLLGRLAETGRPLIVSTGAAELWEVERALGWLEEAGSAHRLALLQCVSSYPTPDEQAELGGISSLRRLFAGPVGYSDHTAGVGTGARAVAVGACMLEKHFTYSRSAAGPDHSASLEPGAFAEYARLARSAWPPAVLLSAMPDGLTPKRVTARERDVRTVSRQSLVAARTLAAGHRIAPGDLTVKRPGTGIPPYLLERVIGATTIRAVAEDAVVTPGDVSADVGAVE